MKKKKKQNGKNVASITVNDAVAADFASVEDDYRGHLSVRDHTGMHCRFDDALPSTAGLLGLIAGQLSSTP